MPNPATREWIDIDVDEWADWVVILDCSCGHEHVAPADEGYQQDFEWRPAIEGEDI